MPIYPARTNKFVILNKENARGINIETPVDMSNEEFLDRINEARSSLIESIKLKLEDEKAKEGQVVEVKDQDKK